MAGKNQWQRQKGRLSGATFVQTYHFVYQSEQWGAMDALAQKLLSEIYSQYNGKNNGDFSAVESVLAERCHSWRSRSVLSSKLKYLEDNGWIVKTRQGSRHDGCNLYAVTWWPIDASDKHLHPPEKKASHLWKKNAHGRPLYGRRKSAVRGARPLNVRTTDSEQTSNQGVSNA